MRVTRSSRQKEVRRRRLATAAPQLFLISILRSAFTASGFLAAVTLSTPLSNFALDLGVVDGLGKTDGALKAAEAALGEVIALAFLLLLLLLLALNGENAVGEG